MNIIAGEDIRAGEAVCLKDGKAFRVSPFPRTIVVNILSNQLKDFVDKFVTKFNDREFFGKPAHTVQLLAVKFEKLFAVGTVPAVHRLNLLFDLAGDPLRVYPEADFSPFTDPSLTWPLPAATAPTRAGRPG